MDNDNTTKKAQTKKERKSAVELENRINRAAELLDDHMNRVAANSSTEEVSKEVRIAHGILIGQDEIDILRDLIGLSDPVG